MKATYLTHAGLEGNIDMDAIIVQPMQHDDGFTLLGFDSWEDVQDEKFTFAVTNVALFNLDRQKAKLGFHENKN